MLSKGTSVFVWGNLSRRLVVPMLVNSVYSSSPPPPFFLRPQWQKAFPPTTITALGMRTSSVGPPACGAPAFGVCLKEINTIVKMNFYSKTEGGLAQLVDCWTPRHEVIGLIRTLTACSVVPC